jgi:hypothetical protein
MMLTTEQRSFYIHELAKDLPPWAYNAFANFEPGTTPVYYSGPYFDHHEIEAALKTFLTGKWLVTGEEVAKFQWKFARKFGVRFAHMVNSGSSANLVMIAALKKFYRNHRIACRVSDDNSPNRPERNESSFCRH